MPVEVKVRLDKRALDRELRDRDGAVGKVIAGFAGLVTVEIKDEMRQRAGGAWWPVSTSIRQGPRGTHSTTTVKKTPAHGINAKNVPNLVFFWEKKQRIFRGPHVNHPGSAVPEKLVLSGIDRASRRVTFTAAAPRVTNT